MRRLRPAAAALLVALTAGCPQPVVPDEKPVEAARRNAPVHAEPSVDTPTHRVAPGETLWRIAKSYGVELDDLARANGLSDPTQIAIGQLLTIPPPRGAAAAPEPSRPAAVSNVEAPRSNAPLAWPLDGVLYARFGPRGETRHDGIDLAAPEGTEVQAAADGTVLFSGEQRGYGQLVIVQHEGGLVTLYAHNQRTLVKEGARVKRGDPVSTVGFSSRTSGPHLHFEVREGTAPKDPMKYLPEP